MSTQTTLQTVNLIDDDKAIRHSLSVSLGVRGYRVQTFESAEQFLSASSDLQYGCLILDLSLPGMDGLELQAECKRQGIELPIIFITAHGAVPESVRALKSGAIDFLEKPFDQQHLLNLIEQAFSIDKLTRQAQDTATILKIRFDQLSQRENEVMQLLVSGHGKLTSRDIASKLGISHRTVEVHRARLMEKTQAKSLTELALMAETYFGVRDRSNPGWQHSRVP